MRVQHMRFLILTLSVCLTGAAFSRPAHAQTQGPVKITLDEAIRLALQHNHTLLAARTTIQQSQAQEMTANLRPDPVLLGDAQFLPIFQPDEFSADYLNNAAQFDLGVSYLFERERSGSTACRRRRTRRR